LHDIEQLLESGKTSSIGRHIDSFNKHLSQNSSFSTLALPLFDGLAMIVRK
jgi:predicted O-methyltransferase YrrM